MLSVPGAQLFTLEVGEGDEVAVVLHGGAGASHDYLRPQMDALAEPGRRRLFYYDQRGGGRSPLAPGARYAPWDEHVADLERVRLHLGEERLTLVGYSWGGLLAQLYTIEHPDRVARLALVSSAPAWSGPREEMRHRVELASRRPDVEALRRELEEKGPLGRRERFALVVAGYFADPRRALELTPFLVRKPAEDAVRKSLDHFDFRPRLAALRLPAFVAHGREDPLPIESARETARLLHAELVELEHTGHVPYVEAPDAFFPPLRRFLDGS